jgi:hypothetical protein
MIDIQVGSLLGGARAAASRAERLLILSHDMESSKSNKAAQPIMVSNTKTLLL